MEFSIFPSITTTTNEWREKIEEATKLGLREAAFFPTCLNLAERSEAYRLLEQSSIESIPFVHLKSDMSVDEIRYLKKNFGTRKFNLHSPLDDRYLPEYDLSEFRDEIYIENSSYPWKDTLGPWAGICLDVTHLEAETLGKGEVLADWRNGLAKYKVGAWHVSAVFDPPVFDEGNQILMYDQHRFDKLERLQYVVKYLKYLPDIISLELENTMAEQLEAKRFLEKIIRGN
jgi:hypothetical protein